MEVPPQSLHWLLCRPCSQKEVPPHALHFLLSRPCSQMEVPPHALQVLLRLLSGGDLEPRAVCVYYCSTYCKAVREGGGGGMCYERLRAEAEHRVKKKNTFLNTVSFVKPSRTGSFTQTCSLCGVLFATRSAAQAACSPASAARAPGQLLGLWAGAGMGSGGCVAQRLTRLTRTWYLQVLQQGVRGGSRRARSQRAVRSHLPTAGSV
jgi:hypothetical protein